MGGKHSIDEWVRYFIVNSLKAPVPFTNLMAVRLSLLTAKEQSKFFKGVITMGIVVAGIGLVFLNLGMIVGGVLIAGIVKKIMNPTDVHSEVQEKNVKVKTRPQVAEFIAEPEEEQQVYVEELVEVKPVQEEKQVELKKEEQVSIVKTLDSSDLDILDELVREHEAEPTETVSVEKQEDNGEALLHIIAKELSEVETVKETKPQEQPLTANKESVKEDSDKPLIELTVHDELDGLLGDMSEK